MAHLSVVIPTYNEGANIAPLLRALRASLAGVETEFIVVDDASGDDTAHAARQEGARTIVRTGERGLATAVVRGLAEARGTFVVVMDADFQHPPEVVARLVACAEATGADVVVGSRYAAGGDGSGFTAPRRVVSLGASFMARTLLPPVRRFRLTDPMSGLFLLRRDCVDLALLHPRGYKILLEILARCPVRRVEEVGYVFSERRGGESKLGAMVMLQFLVHAASLAWGDQANRRAARVTGALGLGALVSLGMLLLLHGVLEMHDLLGALAASGAGALVALAVAGGLALRAVGGRPGRAGWFGVVPFLVVLAVYFALTRFLDVNYLLAQGAGLMGGGGLAGLASTLGGAPQPVPEGRAGLALRRDAAPGPAERHLLISDSSRE